MSGSDVEPVAAEQAASQMQEATDRLRSKGWMVAPMTSAMLNPAPDDIQAEAAS